MDADGFNDDGVVGSVPYSDEVQERIERWMLKCDGLMVDLATLAQQHDELAAAVRGYTRSMVRLSVAVTVGDSSDEIASLRMESAKRLSGLLALSSEPGL